MAVVGHSDPLKGLRWREPGSAEHKIKVFLVCPRGGCEVPLLTDESSRYFELVQNEQSANVIVTVNRVDLGNTIQFEISTEGRGPFVELQSQMEIRTKIAPTRRDEHDAMFKALKTALVPYALAGGVGQDLQVGYSAPTQQTDPEQKRSIWEQIVWEPSVEGFYRKNQNSSVLNLRGQMWGSYIDPNWKFHAKVSGKRNRQTFEIPDEPSTVVSNDGYSFSTHAIKTLGTHWGAGVFWGYNYDTRRNIAKEMRSTIAAEYNIFPYEDAASRALTIQYNVGLINYRYIEPTVHQLLTEDLWRQRLEIRANAVQSWGSIGGMIQFQNYLNHFKQGRIRVTANTDFRILKGLSVRLGGSFALLADQRNIAGGDIDSTTIITQSMEQQSLLNYDFRIGFAYRFGDAVRQNNARLGAF